MRRGEEKMKKYSIAIVLGLCLVGCSKGPKGKDGTPKFRFAKIERADVWEDIAYIKREAVPFWNCVQQRRRPNLKLPPI